MSPCAEQAAADFGLLQWAADDHSAELCSNAKYRNLFSWKVAPDSRICFQVVGDQKGVLPVLPVLLLYCLPWQFLRTAKPEPLVITADRRADLR